MDTARFDDLLQTLAAKSVTRAGLLGGTTAGGLALLATRLAPPEAAAKKKKKCPKPPPQPFCAGKNSCVKSAACQASAPACSCFLRVDAGHIGESFCGIGAVGVPSCESCGAGSVCVLFLGGICPRGEGDFGCAFACPNPR